MATTSKAAIVAAARTAIGTARRGALANVAAIELAKPVVRAVVDRSGLTPSDFDDLVLAQVSQRGGFHELRRRGGCIGVLSMCAGGGQGAAMVIEVA